MEGLVKNLNTFAQNNDTHVVFGTNTDTFHPVCTLEGLQMDLKAYPKGNFVPSPYYLGPTEVTAKHTHVTAVTDAAVQVGETTHNLKAEDILPVNGTFTVVSGWIKSTTPAETPVHEHWKRCLIEQKKPGGFTGLKDSTRVTNYESGTFLLPTLSQVGEYLGALVNSAENIMEYEDKKAIYDQLVGEAGAIDKDVWAKPGHMSKQEKAKKAIDKYNNGGKKSTDLKSFSVAIEEFKKALEKAKAYQKECEGARVELCTAVNSFSQCVARADFPSTNKMMQKSVHSIREALAPHQVDFETGMAAKLVTVGQSKSHVSKIAAFIKRVDAAVNKPKWKSKIMQSSDVLKQTKRVEPKLTTWNVRITQGEEKDVLEQLNQLIGAAKADALLDKTHDVGQILYLADQLQAKFPIETPKAVAPSKKPIDKDAKEEEISDRYADFKDCVDVFKQNKGYMSQEQLDEFNDRKFNKKINEAYENYHNNSSAANYAALDKLFVQAKAFFVDAGVHSEDEEEGSESDEEEDDEELLELESDDEEEEDSSDEVISKRKKRSREDSDDDFIGSIVNAYHRGTNTDRDHMTRLWKSNDRKQFKLAIEDTVKRNTVQYHVEMLGENGEELDPLLRRIIDGTGETTFPERERAVERAKFLQNLVAADRTLTFRIDEIHPNRV